MTKALRKAIVLRTYLRNIYNKERPAGKWNAFKKRRNKCVKTLKLAKRDNHGNLDLKSITNKRKFLKTDYFLKKSKHRLTSPSLKMKISSQMISKLQK